VNKEHIIYSSVTLGTLLIIAHLVYSNKILYGLGLYAIFMLFIYKKLNTLFDNTKLDNNKK